MILRVELADTVVKQLRRVPKHVVTKLLAWVDDVEARGLEEVRSELAGKRAIRLSKQWRAVYVVKTGGSVEFVLVEEVHPHDY